MFLFNPISRGVDLSHVILKNAHKGTCVIAQRIAHMAASMASAVGLVLSFLSSVKSCELFVPEGESDNNKRGKKNGTFSSSRNYHLIERIFWPHAKLRVRKLGEKGKSAGHDGAPMAPRKFLRAHI
jgi:hypothetical protein